MSYYIGVILPITLSEILEQLRIRFKPDGDLEPFFWGLPVKHNAIAGDYALYEWSRTHSSDGFGCQARQLTFAERVKRFKAKGTAYPEKRFLYDHRIIYEEERYKDCESSAIQYVNVINTLLSETPLERVGIVAVWSGHSGDSNDLDMKNYTVETIPLATLTADIVKTLNYNVIYFVTKDNNS